MKKFETQLLELLQEDCRLPLEKLAVMLGATTEKVAKTIDRLEESRVILRYAPPSTGTRPTASAWRR